jgi:hypothetical protein
MHGIEDRQASTGRDLLLFAVNLSPFPNAKSSFGGFTNPASILLLSIHFGIFLFKCYEV